MELQLSDEERMDLLTVANQIPGYDTVERQLNTRGPVYLSDEKVIQEVRDLAAQAMDSGAAERHNLNVQGVYDRANEILFGAKMAKRLEEAFNV